MHGTEDYMPGLLEKLSQYEIAGCFEDPLPGEDIEGYAELRQRSQLPVVLHHFPTAATYEIFRRPADAYMLGHFRIGEAVRKAGLFAAGNSPFMLQNSGSDITRAMTMHMMAAFPSASFHSISATEVSRERFVTEPLHPINGFIHVREQPGLGIELDMKEVERLERVEPKQKPKFIIVCRYENGATLYTSPDPKNPHFMVRPDWSRTLMPMSFAAPLSSEYWDEDGSADFAEMMTRIETEGAVLKDRERP